MPPSWIVAADVPPAWLLAWTNAIGDDGQIRAVSAANDYRARPGIA